MSDPSITIREAVITDVTTICDVIRQAYRDVAGRFRLNADNCPKHPSNYTVQWVEQDFARGVRYYLLEDDHRVLGCAALEVVNDDLCYLERLAVLPHARNRGYGRKLAEYLLAMAGSKQIKQVSIGIIADQSELKKWYQTIGFEEGDTKLFDHLPFKVTFMTYFYNR